MITYDYEDADGYERGDMGRGKPKVKRIYKLRYIDQKTRLVDLTSYDVWGYIINEVLPLHTVQKMKSPIIR